VSATARLWALALRPAQVEQVLDHLMRHPGADEVGVSNRIDALLHGPSTISS
jgi:hypothetical protein